MAALLNHETQYRSSQVMSKINTYAITVCGAGALGANIVENLARAGYGNLTVIDFDRIEEHNLSTQPYYKSDIGGFKAKVLANALYRAIGAKVTTHTQRLTIENTATLLTGTDLIIDAFDNSASRQILKDYSLQTGVDCLHAGLAADYAEVIWNADYRVPSNAKEDICDYPLARNLVILTVAVTCEILTQFLTTGDRTNRSITLQDISIQTM
jgi:molybdopterin-synthase adenylyltransferase